MPRLITMKFGGTSVGSPEAIRLAAEAVAATFNPAQTRVVVVVSAMSGVTDLLQEGILRATDGAPRHAQIASELRSRHSETACALITNKDERAEAHSKIAALVDDFARFCDSVQVIGEATPRARDYVMSLGERMSVQLIAAAFRANGLPAVAVESSDLIVTDERFQDAAPDLERTRARTREVVLPLLEAGRVPVITGFIGATPGGLITTLGRGGSDYSASLIGACLDSDEVWIWTDVDGVMSTDPRVVPDARSIERLTYREVGELAYFGAKVLHPKTLRPLGETATPLWVKNTFNPTHPGTLILPEQPTNGGPVKAVTAIRAVSMISVEGKGMLGVPGIAARTFGAVAATGTSVLLISQASSEQSICFVVPQNSAPGVVRALEAEFARELDRHDIERIDLEDDITIVTVVGARMRHIPGIAARIFGATGAAGINVIAIAQGSSECSVSIVVSEEDGDAAVRAIHALALSWPEG